MRHSYIASMRWMVICEYGVPAEALNLSSTNCPDHGHHRDPPLSGKNPHGRARNRTQDLMVSSQKHWPLDQEAFPTEYCVRIWKQEDQEIDGKMKWGRMKEWLMEKSVFSSWAYMNMLVRRLEDRTPFTCRENFPWHVKKVVLAQWSVSVERCCGMLGNLFVLFIQVIRRKPSEGIIDWYWMVICYEWNSALNPNFS
jgi:hypothetical protein